MRNLLEKIKTFFAGVLSAVRGSGTVFSKLFGFFKGIAGHIQSAFRGILSFLKILFRILRIVCVVAAVLAVAAAGALFYFVNENTITHRIDAYARSALQAQVVYDGKIQITRLPRLVIQLPKGRLVRSDSQTPIAEFQSASCRVSLGALLIGAVKVREATIDSLKTTIHVPSFTGQMLSEGSFSNIFFPKTLRIQNLTLKNATIAIDVGSAESEQQRVSLTQATAFFQRLSPEMQAPFEFSGQFATQSKDTTREGNVSAKGSLNISNAKRRIYFDDLTLAADYTKGAERLTLFSKADRLRLFSRELSGINVSATLSRPTDENETLQVAAVDFRWNNEEFVTPEIRVHSTRGNSTYDFSAAIHWNQSDKSLALDSIASNLQLGAHEGLANPFGVKIEGYAKFNVLKEEGTATLSGTVGDTTFNYRGQVSGFKTPSLKGDVALGTLDLLKLPSDANFSWMKSVSFDGDLRVETLAIGQFSATQLHGSLHIEKGSASLTNALMNLADGRLIGKLMMSEAPQWILTSQIDGVNVEKLLTQFTPSPLLAGVLNGEIEIKGTSLDAASLEGNGSVRLVRSGLKGLDVRALSERVTSRNKTINPLSEGARVSLDEASATIQLKGTELSFLDVAAYSALLRANAEIGIALATGDIKGTVKTTLLPDHAKPSIYANATIDGTCATPRWHFDWEEAETTYARIQGTPLPLEEKAPPPKRSVWQRMKDYLKFW